MCLDKVTDMNETLNIVTTDSSDAVIDLGCEKSFHNGLSDYDNESLYIPIAPTLSEESVILMIADEDAVEHILKNLLQCDRSHGYAHGMLLTLKFVQSSVHHGGGHDVVYTLFIGPPTKFFKRGGGGLTGSQFLEGGC